MSSLLEQGKHELSKAKDTATEQLRTRIPGRRGGASAAVDRTSGRARKATQRVEALGRRAGSGLSGVRTLVKDGIERRQRAKRQRRRKRMGTAAAAGAAGGAGAYFLDPNEGKRRRHLARDKVTALFRKLAGRAERAGRYGGNKVTGKAKGAVSAVAPEKPAPNDESLADRVRSEIFRPAEAPKGSVNVNVENGIVYLRGDAEDPKQVRKLVKNAESVDGVREVKNLIGTS